MAAGTRRVERIGVPRSSGRLQPRVPCRHERTSLARPGPGHTAARPHQGRHSGCLVHSQPGTAGQAAHEGSAQDCAARLTAAFQCVSGVSQCARGGARLFIFERRPRPDLDPLSQSVHSRAPVQPRYRPERNRRPRAPSSLAGVARAPRGRGRPLNSSSPATRSSHPPETSGLNGRRRRYFVSAGFMMRNIGCPPKSSSGK